MAGARANEMCVLPTSLLERIGAGRTGGKGTVAETGTSPNYRVWSLAVGRQLEWRRDSGEGMK